MSDKFNLLEEYRLVITGNTRPLKLSLATSDRTLSPFMIDEGNL